jgi:hypothetical protein
MSLLSVPHAARVKKISKNAKVSIKRRKWKNMKKSQINSSNSTMELKT